VRKAVEITEFEVTVGIYLFKHQNSKYYKAKLYDGQADDDKIIDLTIAEF